jgi:hypothetical protein
MTDDPFTFPGGRRQEPRGDPPDHYPMLEDWRPLPLQEAREAARARLDEWMETHGQRD